MRHHRGRLLAARAGPNCDLVIAYTGAVAPEAIEAVGFIGESHRDVGLLAITSADRLHARLDRRAEFAPRPPRRAVSQPYRKAAGAAGPGLRHRHRDRRPSGGARLARQRARPPGRGARRRACSARPALSATSTATTASTPMPSSMRPKASPSAPRCGIAKWRCERLSPSQDAVAGERARTSMCRDTSRCPLAGPALASSR